MPLTQTALSRRSFLLAATAGTAATAAALLVKNQPQPAASTNQRSESKSGYQLTEHVRNYYRTTRI
jgi:secreted PhoX family phosphatase